MGAYIPEMQMPTNCYDCQIENYVPNCPVYMYFSATEYMEERHPNCPIVEISEPHGRLIDADELLTEKQYEKYMKDILIEDETGNLYIRPQDVVDLLMDAPTVIEAEGE